MSVKRLVRETVNRAGFDVVRLHNSPKRTLLGMAGMEVGAVIDVGANQGAYSLVAAGVVRVIDQPAMAPLADSS